MPCYARCPATLFSPGVIGISRCVPRQVTPDQTGAPWHNTVIAIARVRLLRTAEAREGVGYVLGRRIKRNGGQSAAGATKMRHPIIVIGAGFAGVNAALAAARTLGDPASVVLVSPTPAMTIRPRLYEAGPEGMTVDLPGLIAKIGIEFRVDSLTELDEQGHTIRLASGASLHFSRLVLAVGSRMAVPPLPGAELAHSIDDLAAAVEFDWARGTTPGRRRQVNAL